MESADRVQYWITLQALFRFNDEQNTYGTAAYRQRGTQNPNSGIAKIRRIDIENCSTECLGLLL